MSYVNTQCRHERLNYESIIAYHRVANPLDESIPIILETPVGPDEVDNEIAAVEQVFSGDHAFNRYERFSDERQHVMLVGEGDDE